MRLRTRGCARYALRCHGSFLRCFACPSARPTVRPLLRSLVRSFVPFVRFFVMTVDETMTYFSGFHSQRAPRLFHSRFLASSLCFSAVAADARTDARALALPRVQCLLLPALAYSLVYFLSVPPFAASARHFPLFPCLVKPFDSFSFIREHSLARARHFLDRGNVWKRKLARSNRDGRVSRQGANEIPAGRILPVGPTDRATHRYRPRTLDGGAIPSIRWKARAIRRNSFFFFIYDKRNKTSIS